jgi:two-component system nitrate/nitrite response regulator NarL
MSAVRILVVDDHPLFRQGVVATLDAEPGLSVVAQAQTAAEAVWAARATQPDLILLDVGLPDLSGVEAIGALLEAAPSSRIAMLTVADDTDTVVKAVLAGAAGYLLKGVSGAELVSAVRELAAGGGYASAPVAMKVLGELARDREPAAGGLTERETEVLELIGLGLTNREIGRRLFLSEKTVKHHVTLILQKLNLRNRVEAALYANRAPKS